MIKEKINKLFGRKWSRQEIIMAFAVLAIAILGLGLMFSGRKGYDTETINRVIEEQKLHIEEIRRSRNLLENANKEYDKSIRAHQKRDEELARLIEQNKINHTQNERKLQDIEKRIALLGSDNNSLRRLISETIAEE